MKYIYSSFLIFSVLLCSAFNLYGQSDIYESYVIIDINGSGNTYYDLFATTGNPDFDSANLGTFTPSNTLILNGAQNQTYKCGTHNIMNGFLDYRIYLASGTPGAFIPSEILFNVDDGTSNFCGGTSLDQTWESMGANINVLNGLPSGDYILEVYTRADSDWDGDNISNTTLFRSNSGANYSATFRVDNPPVAICTNYTAQLNSSGTVSITAANVDGGSTDDFGIASLSLDNTTFDCSNIGANTVTLTVTDNNGNVSTCTAVVTVEDNVAPVADIANLADITAECEVTTLTPPTATDKCEGTATVTNDAILPISGEGTTTVVTWTYDDGSGNTSTQTQNVIIDDVTAPVADMANLADITAECEVTTLTPPTATDNCGGTVSVTNDATLPISGEGTTTIVTWTYDDGNGNTSTQTQNVIIDDVTAPVADIANLADITAECEVTTLTPPTATDNCGGTVSVTNDATLPISGEGTTTIVTWTYDDGNGNTSTQTQNVIIDDVTAPVADIANLADITAECEVTTLTPPTAIDNCGGTASVTNDAILPISGEGTTTVVTWTYDDGNGNTSTQTQNVIIDDVTAPVADMANLADITAECEVTTLTPPTATDNCGGTVSVTNDATLPISGEGTTTVVTWTYDDGNGNTSTQTQNVIIDDVTAPTPDVANLADITAECEVTTLTDPTATDNCGGTVSVTNDAILPISGEGTTTIVTWTYDDGNGNTSTQTQNVIIDDLTAPTPDVANLADITAECEVTTLTDPTATDNCGGTASVTNDATLPISGEGTTTIVTWTYDDGNGNTSTQTQNVIIDDVTAPVADIANLADITAECEVTTLTPPTATDNCGGTVSVTNDAILPISGEGTTTVVTWTYNDGNGNTSTQTQNVIIDDVTAPTPDVATLADITAECEVTTLTPPTATDNCGGTITVTNDATLPISGEGTTTVVTWTYDDGNGNTSTQTQNVIINDITAPVADLATLADITAECEVSSLTPPTATDNCGGTVSVTNDATLPISGEGTTTVVTWTYDDGNGNTISQTQNVIIDDVTAPVADIANLADITAECEVTTLTPPTATDNCGGTVSVTNDATLPISGEGTTTIVTWTYDDGNGNTSTQTQNVIIDDVTAPVADIANLADITAECEVTTLTPPTATDNCGGTVSVTNDATLPISGEGTTTIVTWTYDDGNGNTSTQTQNVIIDDVTAPVPNIASLANATGECTVTVTAPAATDNCSGTITATTTDPLTYSSQGTYTITWNYDDGNGNISSQTQTVIVDDVVPPLAVCQDFTVQLDASGNASITAADIDNGSNDTCGIASLSLDQTSFGCGDVGTNSVTLTVTDNNGNISTCNATVTVEDNINPTAICQDITVALDGSGNAIITAADIDNGSSDACGIASLSLDQTSFGCGDVGTNSVTLTVTDNNGNISTCNATVTVEDNINPTAICQDITVALDGSGNAIITAADIDNGSSDACGIASLALDQTSFGCSDVGTNPVTLTVTDNNGNVSTCNATVTVEENTAPTAVCQDIIVSLDPDGTINISPIDIDNGSTDNCGIQSFTVSPTTFTCSDLGPNTVTFIVTDFNGNSSTCSAVVTVEDTTPPTTNAGECGSFELTLDSITGQAAITQAQVNALYTGSDNCAVQSMSLAQMVFGCNDVGTNTVQLTITDTSGNSSTCSATITVNAPVITSGTLTGMVVNPAPDPVVPADNLIEVTACPGGVAVPKDVELTLTLDATSTIVSSNITTWQISTDNGATWTDVAGTTGLTQHTLVGLLTTTLVRIEIQSGSCIEYSPLAIIRFLPPDVPPTIVSISATDICLGDTVTVEAQSFFETLGGGQWGEGGLFNQAQPEGWRVDGIDGFFPASGNNQNEPTWKETNGPTIQSGIRYDTNDNTKFAIAHGPVNTTLETPIFNTVGMDPADAILEFHTAYYFCNGGYGVIELSTDGGVTYDIVINTDQNPGGELTSPNTTGVQVNRVSSCNGNGPNAQRPTADPFEYRSINLSGYLDQANLRIRFSYFGNTTECTNSSFPAHPNNTCNNIPSNFDVYSGWVIDDVRFPFAVIDEILEWTDEDGVVVATGNTVTVTPPTPGVVQYGVTSLVNGCRADTDAGTEFIAINASLAYAGQDFTPIASNCGQSTINLRAYDNTITAIQNFDLNAWEAGLYAVPDIAAGDTDYPGTGVGGAWSIIGTSNGGCGTSATFSSNANPRAIFTADPGTYTLRWALANGCFDDVTITINSCDNIDFDGVNDFATLKDNYVLNSSFSIESWVKPQTVSGDHTIFSKKNATDNTSGYVLNIENGIVKFNWYNSSGSGAIESQYAINTSRWYHVAVTFDGADYNLFIDGISVGTVTGAINAPQATSSDVEALIGAIDNDNRSNNNVIRLYHGWMDELRIWNTALTTAQIRQMMNQEIEDNTAVRGAVVPLDVVGLTWANLDGYYRMNVACGYLEAYKGVRGRLRNMSTAQQETAPLPYTSRVDGQDWATDNTWTNFNVWDAPNSIGIDGATPIDWNIVQISHDINSGDKDITVLGLISDVPNKVLDIKDPGSAQDETNDGQFLRVTHYLKLDGDIDLFGESQLLQDEGSVLDVSSAGQLERDQQGTANLYNYNYWSSPVSALSTTSNNNPYGINDILRDGTNSGIPLNLQWTTSQNADGSTTPITQSSRWLYAYENFPVGNTPEEGYAQWRDLAETDVLATGLSFTMKGSGAGDPILDVQNYVFVGKPNNGTITTPLTIGNQALVGNPYPSAIDANQFIRDNLPGGSGNAGSTQSTDGTLYFWEHYTSNFTHILEDYEGGYATFNLSGGNQAVSGPLVSGIGTPTKLPGQYIPVSQGFFVSASNIGGAIQFKNSQRVFEREALASSQFFRTNNPNMYSSQEDPNPEIQRVRINFTTEDGAIRPLLLAFVPNGEATDGVDFGYDAENADDEFPNDMFWRIENGNYTTQGVGDFDISKQYPLGLFINAMGTFEISLQNLENFDEDVPVYIYDSLFGSYFEINDEAFQITLDPDTYLDRFYVTFSSEDTLSTPDDELSQTTINYLNTTKEIYVRVPMVSEVKEIQLINLLGQEIQSWDNTSEFELDGAIRIPVKNISEGTYIIKVNTNSRVNSSKVIVKE